MSERYTVIRDTREQKGWSFGQSGFCTGTVSQGLPTGDYSLIGYEKDFVIERKGSTSEIAGNLVDDRFKRELERLEGFAHPFIICEFTIDDIMNFPVGSGIPACRWKGLRIKPPFLLSCLMQLQVKYKTKVIFAGRHGKDIASSLFKRVVDLCPCPQPVS